MKKPKFLSLLRHRKLTRRQWLITVPVALIVLIIGIGAARAALNLGGSNRNTSSSTAINLQKGLISWWKLNGNTKDSTPYANNATNYSATATTDRKGLPNGAYSFNGSSSHIEANAEPYSSSITVSAWVYSTNFSQYGFVVGQGPVNSQWELFFEAGVLRWRGGASDNNTSCPDPANNAWHHVVGTQSGTTTQLFIDGQRCSTATSTAIPTSGAYSVDIGRYNYFDSYPGYYYNGSISDVKIYNRVLSSPEVTALYSEYNPAIKADSGENGLVSWWKMQGNAKDATPSNNTGILENSPTLTTDRKGQANSAYAFNGSTQYMTSTKQFNNPTTFTLSMWFKTTTAAGGKLIGLGNQQTGGSTLDDRHIYMSNTGQLYFGVYTTAVKTVNSSLSYNDGKWHLVTASLSSSGMMLYADGQLVGSDPTTTTAYNYSGYWRVGDDTLGGWPGNPSSAYFNGSISDVRVYNKALSLSQIAALYQSYNSQLELSGSGASGSVSLGKGLVGDWVLNGSAKDNTPYSDNGTVSGAVLGADRKGRANSAYTFNGTSSYIGLANASQLNFNTSSPFSIAAWIKGPYVNGQEAIFSKYSSTTGGYIFNELFGYLDLYMATSASVLQVYCGPPLSDSKWHYVVVTYSGNSLASGVNMYVDGASEPTVIVNNNLSGSIANTQPATIGNYGGGSTWYWNGSLDNVRVYNRVLTAAEVLSLYKEY